jgi:hypothetical protein
MAKKNALYCRRCKKAKSHKGSWLSKLPKIRHPTLPIVKRGAKAKLLPKRQHQKVVSLTGGKAYLAAGPHAYRPLSEVPTEYLLHLASSGQVQGESVTRIFAEIEERDRPNRLIEAANSLKVPDFVANDAFRAVMEQAKANGEEVLL